MRHDGGRLTEVTSLLVLGLGLTALFLDVENWWLIFAIGYAVVVPIVAILTDEDRDGEGGLDETDRHLDELLNDRSSERPVSASKRDALETLRERYARGELTEEQFERKVETLLDTETLEDARSRVERGDRAAGSADDEREREPE